MNENNKSFTDEVFEYIDDRSHINRIMDEYSRGTYLVSHKNLEALDNTVNFIDLLGSVDGEFANSHGKDAKRYRQLSKNFKTVAINLAIKNIIEEFENEHGGNIPKVEKVRFKNVNGLYHRAYLVTSEDETYYQELDNRGNTEKYFSDKFSNHLFASHEEMQQLFNQRLKLAGKFEDDVIEDMPTKRSILDELED